MQGPGEEVMQEKRCKETWYHISKNTNQCIYVYVSIMSEWFLHLRTKNAVDYGLISF